MFSVCVLCVVSAFCLTWLTFFFCGDLSDCLPFVSNPPDSSASSPGRDIRSFCGSSTHPKETNEEKEKREKKKKKSSRFQLAFSRNCQTCIHIDPRMQRARALTLSPPHSFKLKTTEFLLWPARETNGIFHKSVYIYLARQPLSFSKTRERKEKRKEYAHIHDPSASFITCCLWWQGNTRTRKLCQVLSS